MHKIPQTCGKWNGMNDKHNLRNSWENEILESTIILPTDDAGSTNTYNYTTAESG